MKTRGLVSVIVLLAALAFPALGDTHHRDSLSTRHARPAVTARPRTSGLEPLANPIQSSPSVAERWVPPGHSFMATQPTATTAMNWRNHVFTREAASWNPDWDRTHVHFWRGHWCRFVNGQWVVFDLGFYPYDSYAYDYYPDGYYAYDYPDETYQAVSDSVVRQVQVALDNDGYNAGPADGEFGTRTRVALSDYQRDHGLAATGQITDSTLKSLGVAS